MGRLAICVTAGAAIALAVAPAASARTSPPPGQAKKADPCAHLPSGQGGGLAAQGRELECLARAGAGIQRADFNGDGVGDLAVGVPDEDVGAAPDAGAVNVIYGSPAGLTATGNQFLTQGSSRGLNGDIPETGDKFGSALAAGNFNADGFADLAVGIPFEDVGAATDSGMVMVFYGSATGLTLAKPGGGSDVITQASTPDPVESGDLFGFALTWGELGRGGAADLVVGVPGESLTAAFIPKPAAGAIDVLYGSATGITATGSQQLTQDATGVDPSEPFDRFGSALTSANFGGGAFGDVAVGAPLEDLPNKPDAGSVIVLYSNSTGTGMVATNAQLFTQDTPDIEQTAGAGDRFGSALTGGDFRGDGSADLVVGAPFDDVFLLAAERTVADAGVVNVIYSPGSPLLVRLTPNNDQVLDQSQPGMEDQAEAGDRFGTSLAANNHDGAGSPADLDVGAPFEDVSNATTTVVDTGSVHTIYSVGGKLDPALGGTQRWTQLDVGIDLQRGAQFGAALSAWNFGRDSTADLAIGVPFETLGDNVIEPAANLVHAGEVDVVYGTPNGLLLDDAGAERWSQATPGILDEPEANDHFGAAMY